jgi:hypothetical protein
MKTGYTYYNKRRTLTFVTYDKLCFNPLKHNDNYVRTIRFMNTNSPVSHIICLYFSCYS